MSTRRTKPLTFDEKRSKILDIFHGAQDFWQLKEIEKIASTKKGSVKEVVDSLVSDNLVCVEKIGSSNYYWAFTSAIVRQLEDAEAKRDALAAEVKTLEKKIASERAKKPETSTRKRTQGEISEELASNRKLKDQLSQRSSLCPELLSKKINATEVAKASANRWTENIFSIRSYCHQNFNISMADFDKQFGIPPNFDLID